MRPIATWSFAPYLENRTHWHNTEELIACTVASIESFDKFYGRPKIYTDDLGVEIFSQLTDKADFINTHEQVFEKHNLSPALWAFPKLYTYSLQQQPYLHFDLDLILHKPLSGDQYKVLVQHWEDVNCEGGRPVYNWPDIKHRYDWSYMDDHINVKYPTAPNVGILGMNDMNIHQIYVREFTEFLNNNTEMFNTIVKDRLPNRVHSCIVEQHLLGVILNREQVPANTVDDDVFTHFVGTGKTSEDSDIIRRRHDCFGHLITDQVIRLANKVDSMRYRL